MVLSNSHSSSQSSIVQLKIVEQYIRTYKNKQMSNFCIEFIVNPDKYNRGGAISDAPQVRGGAIFDALQVRSGAICDAPFGEPEKCCIKNCYIVVSLNKVLIILMLGSLLEVH